MSNIFGVLNPKFLLKLAVFFKENKKDVLGTHCRMIRRHVIVIDEGLTVEVTLMQRQRELLVD